MAAVAEQGPGQGFCLTWDLAGEKEQAVRAFLLGLRLLLLPSGLPHPAWDP